MKGITKQLAQDIVRRTMGVIGYNVNVMDEHGRIIGSGDKMRIGKAHEGALLAIKRRGRFEIDEASAAKLQGVLPGTNLVIEFQDEVVGVIGITGDPKEVTKYGELVKMTAEMYLEQMYLLEQAQWDKRMRADFLLSVISAEEKDTPSLRAQAQRIGFNADVLHTACIIELAEVKLGDSLDALKRVADLLEGRSAINLIAIRNSQQVVLFKEQRDLRTPNRDIYEGISQIREWLNARQVIPIRIAVGMPFVGIEGMMASFQSAQDALLAGRATRPEDNVYYAVDMPLEVLTVKLKRNWMTDALIGLWDRFIDEDRSGELRQTFEVYYANSGEANRIAASLAIHRNTLRYRLQRIAELTGKDPRNYTDLYILMHARWLYAAKELNME
ncbi:sugar diacid recognition domain-containing protein [Paenibacillus sp. UMB4589-SE434]|uniref:sugar diacid recognition domain-containing protein n=1 Tax=Paenibacillus sp. UMB4589-SE434 TaxID=3046314 RepID=UPI0025504BFA|nr:sugar diacid recognition domain-containing protein [Paenibacillus sp. UMB4589-SE434]MDK8183905.1 sugar diacid recognition domain-containing protein [Paenibacillus sp. UMB4589-SE434]